MKILFIIIFLLTIVILTFLYCSLVVAKRSDESIVKENNN